MKPCSRTPCTSTRRSISLVEVEEENNPVLDAIRYRLRAAFARGAMDRELDDELRFHIEKETEKHMRAGLTRAAAERAARLAFGSVVSAAESSRDIRGW